MTPSREERLARKQARQDEEARKAEQLRHCVLEGWPLKEIYRTYRTSSRFLKRWFPDYTGLPAQESGSLSKAIQRHRKELV